MQEEYDVKFSITTLGLFLRYYMHKCFGNIRVYSSIEVKTVRQAQNVRQRRRMSKK